MAGKNVDTNSMRQAAKALSVYIDEVQQGIQKMRDAAVDCRDNMGNEEASKKSIIKLEECIKKLSKTLKEAESLRKRIIAKANEIDDIMHNY